MLSPHLMWIAPSLPVVALACSGVDPAPLPHALLPRGAELGAQSATSRDPSGTGRTIVKLETRDHILFVDATRDGPRLTLARSDGAVIARDLQPAALERYAPELRDVYEGGYATLDARVDPELLQGGARGSRGTPRGAGAPLDERWQLAR